ncbi:MAG: hypothetical protein ACF8OB_06065 [Phycisphaeraceae bacterium JB051]
MPNKLAISLCMVATAIALPVLVPVACIMRALSHRRLIRIASRTLCTQCQQTLGHAAIDKANEHWQKNVNQARAEHPGKVFRLERDVYAICCNCDAAYTFNASARTFARQSDQPQFQGISDEL